MTADSGNPAPQAAPAEPTAPTTPAVPATPPVASTPPAAPATPATPLAAPAAPAAAPIAQASPAKWPDDWRVQMATVDGKLDDSLVKLLERHTDPGSLAKKIREQDKLISSGKLKGEAPPDNATPEQMKAWRLEHGIPEAPDGYLAKLPNGLVVGDNDKPLVDDFTKAMHGKNAPPALVHEALGWYYRNQEAKRAEQAEKDTLARAKTEQVLDEKWGPEKKLNLSIIHSLLDVGPAGIKDQILNSRLPDGTPFSSDAQILGWLADTARQTGISGPTTVPGGGTGALTTIEGEIAQWEAKMGDKHSDYWSGANAERNQARYRALITDRDMMKKRAAA